MSTETDLDDFPYRAEYAKSSRASCRQCKGNIEKGILRLAVLIQSPSFDGKITHWYHYSCFFTRQKPKSVQDIANFDSLRWEDQKKIQEKLDSTVNGTSKPSTSSSKAKGKKKSINSDFSVEYAKSGRATCRGCEEKILKDEIRISKLDYEDEKAKRFGPMPRWHHVKCFIKEREALEYWHGGEDLPGFNTLSADDKKMLRDKIKKMKKRPAEAVENVPDSSAPKKIKIESEETMKKQNDKLFYYRDRLKALKLTELGGLLTHNGYVDTITGLEKHLDVLCDMMTFGVAEKCSVCKNGLLVFRSGVGYMCRGNLSEWTKCRAVIDNPQRTPFLVPAEFVERYPFLSKYKYKPYGNRIVIKREVSQVDGASSGKSKKNTKPLDGLKFVLCAVKNRKELKEKIEKFGGEIKTKVNSETAAVVTKQEKIDSKDKTILSAKVHSIECVSDDFIDGIRPEVNVSNVIGKKNMAPWALNTEERISKLCKKSRKPKSASQYEELPEKLKKIVLKDGNHIDPRTEMEHTYHVYKRKEKSYSVVLGLVDVARGTNSYYKLQILESDNKREYAVYRSWGRIGTTIGDFKVTEVIDLKDAFDLFNQVYEEKSGNKFLSLTQEKVPGRWYPLEIDHGQSKDKINRPKLSESKSKLPKPIQELICLIFDVNKMEDAMVQYELDLKKMPLGKLSTSQLEKAYSVLSEAQDLLIKAAGTLENAINGDIASVKSENGVQIPVKSENGDQIPVKSENGEPLSNCSQSTDIPSNKSENFLTDSLSKLERKVDLSMIRPKILDCSNRFYTLLPHDFGMNAPPLLDSLDLIKNKIEMIDNLREIEVAYSLLQTQTGNASAEDAVDDCYAKLKAKIDVLDRKEKEFSIIEKYVENTHAETHSSYKLKIDEVFKIDRSGEGKRYKPFKKLHNRQLLWHGSRLTNFAGILSQGLRIAPKEAPSTGYMFGKGIYFADMVSKSANYCAAYKENPTGLLLLCEVALGDMMELKNAKCVRKLPAGKHSVKGVGITQPDPAEALTENGVQIPLGTSQPSGVKHSHLLYNEYIVYDVAQVNVKYLVKTTFDFKY